MNYRISSPEEHGFSDEEEEFDAIYEQVQDFLGSASSEHLVDTLLVIAKLAELRALLMPHYAEFYKDLGQNLRILLSTFKKTDPLPNQKLEDDRLYFPPVEGTH